MATLCSSFITGTTTEMATAASCYSASASDDAGVICLVEASSICCIYNARSPGLFPELFPGHFEIRHTMVWFRPIIAYCLLKAGEDGTFTTIPSMIERSKRRKRYVLDEQGQ